MISNLADGGRSGTSRVLVVIVARNEEDHLPDTLSCLLKQTLPVAHIVLVDDGSEDGTPTIASERGCQVIRLPYHPSSYVGLPHLAHRWNYGLREAKRHSPDYVLTMGADHFLPPQYVETLVSRMEEDPQLVVASGVIRGTVSTESAPLGSGRLVNANYWKKVSGLQFPTENGWESWFLHKANSVGLKAKCFIDLESDGRPTDRHSPKKMMAWGKGMWCLGYHWMHALLRSSTFFLMSPKAGSTCSPATWPITVANNLTVQSTSLKPRSTSSSEGPARRSNVR